MQPPSPKKHQASTNLADRGYLVSLPDIAPRKSSWKQSRFFPLAALVSAAALLLVVATLYSPF